MGLNQFLDVQSGALLSDHRSPHGLVHFKLWTVMSFHFPPVHSDMYPALDSGGHFNTICAEIAVWLPTQEDMVFE